MMDRVHVLRVPIGWVLAYLQGQYQGVCEEVIASPLPADATLVRAWIDDRESPGFVYCVIASDSYEPVPQGYVIPSVPPPLFRRWTAKEWVDRFPEGHP